MSPYIRPLPAPADKILSEFVERICAIEPDFITGIYITGSLALNDFYPYKSDIDFIVICRTHPDEKFATCVKKIHQSIAGKYRNPDLSGSYIALEALQNTSPENIPSLSFHENVMRYQPFEMAIISLAELNSNAITLFGSPATTLPVVINCEILNRFLYNNINTYWKSWIKTHSSLFERKMILITFPRFTEWSVLGVARQLYSLRTGKIVSKSEAGNYCLHHLPERFKHVISKAISIRKDNRTYPLVGSYGISPSLKRADQTIECVNYIIEQFNREYTEIT